MVNSVLETFIRDALWLIVIAGWIFLIANGLEADKPLSGGIPGHANPNEDHHAEPEGTMGRLGVYGSWVIFGIASLALPIILWWIFLVHPG
ncbi:MAG: hypothetical protein NT075_28725 [Chloroflexi bacterium]|nr:hypothetical protein [Chloroflexota bacterium]